jgi:hypothetical protein
MATVSTLTSYPIDQCDALAWTTDATSKVIRTSTAVSVDGGCLLIDPVDDPGLDELVAPLGSVVGVCTLLDRHRRDAKSVAARHGCPVLVPSTLAGSGEPLDIPGIQERAILAAPGWNESALWFPDRGLIVTADALGTSPYFLASDDEKIGVHPLLRLRPPVGAFRGLEPVAVATGHGEPLTEDAAAAVRHAISTARPGIPRTWWRIASSAVHRSAA